MAYAHSRNALGLRHDLVDHLRGVADLAGEFATALGASEAGRFVGLWHDVGKFDPAWQQYLLNCEAGRTARGHGPDHKAAGTQLAMRCLSLAALLIQGHHGGLKAAASLEGWLTDKARRPAVAEALARARATMPDLEPSKEISLPAHAKNDPHAAEMFLRLLFSALVDADSLDTERHDDAGRADLRTRRGEPARIMATLWERFEQHHQAMPAASVPAIDAARRAIFAACLTAAEHPPGLFRLAAPTGGGKTLSSMAFALRHARRWDQRRVIVAVPFISITEQTADTYRDAFGAEPDGTPVVLEHHSGSRDLVGGHGEPEDGEFAPGATWSRLVAENWDAPIVVTTTVQLFESLFSRGRRGCRKLHRLAKAVIILDEAQALPIHLLAPILDALRELCDHYGTTVVISTATQPAFEVIPPFRDVPATDILPDAPRLFGALRRVDYEWLTECTLPWTEVADLMRAEPRALAVLNTKKDALALFSALNDAEALHLSTLLCGAHRRRVIAEVKRRLAATERCRLISTQVVEAGVDLDFSLVLRAVAPLDSVIQAAGRCNREGRLGVGEEARGRVIVFRPEGGGMPDRPYALGAQITETLRGRARAGGHELDPDHPATARDYFVERFKPDNANTDSERIQAWREQLDYVEVASRFRMIDTDTEEVVVPYGIAGERRTVAGWLADLHGGRGNARELLRKLQPFMVSLRTHEAARHRRQGFIAEVRPDLSVGEWLGRYDATLGLAAADPDPDTLVV